MAWWLHMVTQIWVNIGCDIMAYCLTSSSKTMTRNNVYLSSKVSCDIHLRAIEQVFINLTCSMYSEITLLKLLPYLPGATELSKAPPLPSYHSLATLSVLSSMPIPSNQQPHRSSLTRHIKAMSKSRLILESGMSHSTFNTELRTKQLFKTVRSIFFLHTIDTPCPFFPTHS